MGILGTQEKGWGSYSIPKNYLAVKKVTASGSGYLTTSYAEFSPDDAYDNDFKLGLWKSSGKLIGVSDAITITAGGSNETFYELSWSNDCAISAGVEYYIGILSNNNTYQNNRAKIYYNVYPDSYPLGTDGGVISMYYNTPDNFLPNDLSSLDVDAITYITYIDFKGINGSFDKINTISQNNINKINGVSMSNINKVGGMTKS